MDQVLLDRGTEEPLTVFKDQPHGGHAVAADDHDGVVSGRLGEGLGLAVGVEDQAASLVQQLLVVQGDAGPAAQQLLEQRGPVDAGGTAGERRGGAAGAGRRGLLRVVLVDVDVVQRGLLQAEHVDHGPVQDVVGLCEELVEAPALLLVGLQDVGQDRGQEALETPERPGGQLFKEPQPGRSDLDRGGWRTWTDCRTPASRSSTRSSRSHTSDDPRSSRTASL